MDAGRRGDRSAALGTLAAVALSLTAILYGRHLADGFLSDDFLYLKWARDGIGTLLRHVTVDSNPKMIRPLPAMFWRIGSSAAAAGSLHALSFALHAANSTLVGWIALRREASRAAAVAASALFASFPLFPEAVVWTSASADLWATLFSLIAVWLVIEKENGTRVPSVVLAFGAALLCKESVLLLPVVLVLLAAPESRRRLAGMLGALLILYIGVRWVLFAGIGGYLDREGNSLVRHFSPLAFGRALFVQLPYRIVLPIKRLEQGRMVIAAISCFVLALAASAMIDRKRLGSVVTAMSCFGVALLPAAPIFRVEVDHEGSRFLYLPTAVGFIVLASASRMVSLRRLSLALPLLVFWGVATVANGRSWTRAAAACGAAVDAMVSTAKSFPRPATVVVDARDTVEGAYSLRNGLAEAASLLGIDVGIDWRRGHGANLAAEERGKLGASVFVVGFGATGEPRDLTECERRLLLHAGTIRVEWKLGDGVVESGSAGSVSKWIGPESVFDPASSPIGVAIDAAACVSSRPLRGTLFWRTSSRYPFTHSEAREFRIEQGETHRCVVRLTSDLASAKSLQVRIEFESAVTSDCGIRFCVVELPSECR